MLSKRDVRRLHRAVEERWGSFVDDAPDDWPKDFLSQVRPTLVAMRYGQNKPISLEDDDALDSEARSFDKKINWNVVKYMNVAIAGTIKCVMTHAASCDT